MKKKHGFWVLCLLCASGAFGQQASGVFGQQASAYRGLSPMVRTMSEYRNQVQQDTLQALINLATYIPSCRLDVRYATTQNFTHFKLYPFARAYLRLAAAKALKKVSQELANLGFGLVIYDGYRPYSVTIQFYNLIKDTQYVASPRSGSRHNRGCAIDLGLVDLAKGTLCEMPTDFDSFSPTAASDCMAITETQLRNRTLLSTVMQKYGFVPLRSEWWHYDFSDWKRYPLLDIPFEDLEVNAPK